MNSERPSDETLDRELKQAKIDQANAETEKARAEAKHLNTGRWLIPAAISGLVAIVLGWFSASFTINRSGTELGKLRTEASELKVQTIELADQLGQARRESNEAIVRNFWVSHVLRALEPQLDLGDAYRGYIHSYYDVMKSLYDALPEAEKKRIEGR
jgi:hypothetical protein